MKKFAYLMTAILFVATLATAQPNAPLQKDATNCYDHPLFTRMPTYWIHNCTVKEFDAYSFPVGAGRKTTVEGKYWMLSYYPQASATTKPSALQIQRNFENAAKRLGATRVGTDRGIQTYRLTSKGKEVWFAVSAEFTGKYSLNIIEKEAMKQSIEANADFFSDSLQTTGHAAVYGILFDTGKSEIKPESEQAIAEIAKLLKSNPTLKLYVVGHTDAVGVVEANLRLSQVRADAVTRALVSSYGVSAARLRPFGNGPFAPVASNDDEDGRAKNRRVELVKQ